MLGWIYPLAVSESRNTTLSALLESHVKSSLLRGYETRELTATQENTLLFQLALLLPCCSATILSHPLLLLLIVNDFFKCEAVSLTLSLGRCHIPRCKSEVNPQIGFPLAACLDVVRMGVCARSMTVCCLACKREPQTRSSKWLWSCSSESFTSEMESMWNTPGQWAMRRLMLKTRKAWLSSKGLVKIFKRGGGSGWGWGEEGGLWIRHANLKKVFCRTHSGYVVIQMPQTNTCYTFASCLHGFNQQSRPYIIYFVIYSAEWRTGNLPLH